MADPLVDAYLDGHGEGWDEAMSTYGLHDCTVRNNGDHLIRVPLKDCVCYIELSPGEEVSLRTVI
jgi:hypothetical protein